MSKVWIVSNSGHDYEDAKKFGEVDFLFPQRQYPFGRFDVLEEEFDKRNVQENDYLLLSGPVLINAVAVTCCMMKFGFANLLVFDARKQTYVEKVYQSNVA